MEERKLNFNAPLLSVRRFSGISSFRDRNKQKEVENPPPAARYALPWYGSDASLDQVTEPVAVPFEWERIPGEAKGGVEHEFEPNKDVYGTPRLPPGRVSQVRKSPVEKEFVNQNVVWRKSPVNDHATQLDCSNEGMDEKRASESEKDDDDDAFSDAVDTLSPTDSFSANCSISGLSGFDGPDGKPSGTFSTDPQTQDFMLRRFLPAAMAMTLESPHYASRKQSPAPEKPREVTKLVVGDRKPPVNQYESAIVPHNDHDVDQEETDDEYDDYQDSGNLSRKACGLLPRLCFKNSMCLLNPVPGLKVEPHSSMPATRDIEKPGKATYLKSQSQIIEKNAMEFVQKNKLDRVQSPRFLVNRSDSAQSPRLSKEKTDREVQSPRFPLNRSDSAFQSPRLLREKPDREVQSPRFPLNRSDSAFQSPRLLSQKPERGVESPRLPLNRSDSAFQSPRLSREKPDRGVQSPRFPLNRFDGAFKPSRLSKDKSDTEVQSSRLPEIGKMLICTSNQFSSTNDQQMVNWSPPQKLPGSGRISPYRRERPQSPFRGGGFLGMPKEAEKFKANMTVKYTRSNNNSQELVPYQCIGQGSGFLSSAAEKTLYVDSVNFAETSIPNSNSSDTKVEIDSMGKHSGTLVEESAPFQDIKGISEYEIEGSVKANQPSFSDKPDLRGQAEMIDFFKQNGGLDQESKFLKHIKVRVDRNPSLTDDDSSITADETSTSSGYSPHIPPLPKTPSQSWLWRALPSKTSRTSSSQSYNDTRFKPKQQEPKIPTSDTKWETIVKTSYLHHDHVRYSEELVTPFSQQSKT